MSNTRDRLAWRIELDEVPGDIDDALTGSLAGFKRQGDSTIWAIKGFRGDIYVEMTVTGSGAVLQGYQYGGLCTHMGEKRLNITYIGLKRHYPKARSTLFDTRGL